MIKTTLVIEGMACSMCEAHINDVVRRTCRVKKVSSSHTKGRTEILSDKPLDLSALKDAIRLTGCTVVSDSAEPYEKRRLFSRK